MLRRSKGHKGAEDQRVDRSGVLVAGDDPDALELLARLLEREGHDVNRATDSDDALSAVMLHPYLAAVIAFTGRSTAMALLDAIRNHGTVQVSGTRVVIVSDDRRNQRFAWESGVDGYLAKPFHSDEFIAEVGSVLDRPEDERAAHRQAQLAEPGED